MQVTFDPHCGWSAAPPIPYRGNRDYLHGTDLYAAASALVASAAGSSQIAAFDVRYPRFTRCSGTFRLTDGEINSQKSASSPVRIQARTTDNRLLTGWFEETDVPPLNRSENCESAIVSATEIAETIARYKGKSGPPTIEIIVFMTKTLLLKLYPEGSGKWVFTALRSKELLSKDNPTDIEIILDSAVGSRAAASSVVIGGKKFGDIYFGRADG